MNPALTAAEWRAQLGDPEVDPHSPSLGKRLMWATHHVDRSHELTLTPYGLAALCLHGQPNGFTREDAENHRSCAGFLSKAAAYRVLAEWHHSMADRIEALLPPEDTNASLARARESVGAIPGPLD